MTQQRSGAQNVVFFILGTVVLAAVVLGIGLLLSMALNTVGGLLRGAEVTLVGGLYVFAGLFIVGFALSLGAYVVWSKRDRDDFAKQEQAIAALKSLAQIVNSDPTKKTNPFGVEWWKSQTQS